MPRHGRTHWLRRYDWDAIAASVRRTARVLIAHEDCLSFGYGAEIAARAADELFPFLDAPVRRVAAKDVFCGYAPRLEEATLPQTGDIHDALVARPISPSRSIAWRSSGRLM